MDTEYPKHVLQILKALSWNVNENCDVDVAIDHGC